MLTKLKYEASQLLRKGGVDFDERKHPTVNEMQRVINGLGSIQFKIELYPDGSWTAESVNPNGIITGGKSTKEINSNIKDAIFTYFEISPHLVNDDLLKADNEPAVVTERVYATR